MTFMFTFVYKCNNKNEIKLDFYKIPLLKIKKIIPQKLYGCNYYSKKELKLETIKNLCDE